MTLMLYDSGGFLTHCNPPYGDIYMSVDEPVRRQGYGISVKLTSIVVSTVTGFPFSRTGL